MLGRKHRVKNLAVSLLDDFCQFLIDKKAITVDPLVVGTCFIYVIGRLDCTLGENPNPTFYEHLLKHAPKF